MNTKDVIKSQYHASLEMLKQVIEGCPPELWNSSEHKNRYWNVAAHVLFYTHLYLHITENEFQPWPKLNLDARSFEPREDGAEKQPLTQSDVLEYLAYVQAKVDPMVEALDLNDESGFNWLPFNKLELQFYNIRHVMEHTGELAERLWQSAGVETRWVGKRPEGA
jgi:hypothetical protein